MDQLEQALADAARTAERFASKGITEHDTRNALIEPVLEALGWPKYNLDIVRAEYRHTSKDNPVDYALFAKGRPVLFVEAKALDISIEDHKAVSQVVSYANVSGVNWAVLTNGRQWQLYSVFAKVQADQKRFFSVSVGEKHAAEWLRWIMPARVSGNDLETKWRQCYAERKLRTLLRSMLAQRDTEFVEFLARHSQMDAGDVAAGLQHLNIVFSEPEVVPFVLPPPKPPDPPAVVPPPPPLPPPLPKAVRLPAPTPGTRPVVLRIGDEERKVNTWRDLLLASCKYAARVRPDDFSRALSADEFQGHKSRKLSAEKGLMRMPIPIPGGFVETHLSAQDIVRLISRLLVFCGIPLDRVAYRHGAISFLSGTKASCPQRASGPAWMMRTVLSVAVSFPGTASQGEAAADGQGPVAVQAEMLA